MIHVHINSTNVMHSFAAILYEYNALKTTNLILFFSIHNYLYIYSKYYIAKVNLRKISSCSYYAFYIY